VHRGRSDAAGAEPIHLVFHERNQRRDHDGAAIQQRSRKLEAERLSGPRRHDGDDVATLEHGTGGLELSGAEVREPKSAPEGLVERRVGGWAGCGHPEI
jgi:hypothetical protein